MKLILQIAAGIIVAGFVMWVGSCAFTIGALHALPRALPQIIGQETANLDPATELKERQHEEDVKAERKFIEKQQRCQITTADGRTLYCTSN